MFEKQRLELAEKVKTVFHKVKHPGQLLGDLEELHHLVDKNWESLSLSEINETDGLTFYSREGFQYFLPAYLIAILEYPDAVAQLIRDRLIRALSHYDSVWGTSLGKLCDIFTRAQIQVIIEFLELYDVMFPMELKFEDNLTEVQRRALEALKSDRDQKLKQAIEYWKGCS